MAIAVDGSSPIRFTGTPATDVDITSASFTPPASSVLVVSVSMDTDAGGNATIVVSDSQTSTWTLRAERDSGDVGAAGGGHASIFTASPASSVSMTVSVRNTVAGASGKRMSVKVEVVTGADTASPVGAVGEGSSTTNNLTAAAYTSTVNNSRGFGCATDWSALGVPTSTDTEDGATYAGAISVISAYKAADTATSGTAVTLNFDAPAGTPDWNWVAIEVKPGAGGGGVALAGIGSAATSATGTLSTTAALTSSAPVACEALASLSATVPISAIAQIACSASGTLISEPQLAGSCNNAASSISTLTTAVALIAIASSSASARARLTNPGGGSPFPGFDLPYTLNRLAGTTHLDADGAANAWAGTTGLALVRALNAKAGTNGVELNGVCKTLADQLGGNPDLDGPGALSEIPS